MHPFAGILLGFDNTLVWHSHTHSSQSSINSDVIHAFFWVQTITSLQKYSYGTLFLFIITYGGNLLPFSVIHSMTVTRNFL
jgi:hypothetical protein